MTYAEFEELISAPRLSRYYATCGGNKRKTRSLYKANIRLSQDFLAILCVFEIVLRNKIDKHYSAVFPTDAAGQDWLLQAIQPGGFFDNNGCRKTYDKIRLARQGLGALCTHHKPVAELSFGVWKFMFSGHQFYAGGSGLLTIFPSLPAGFNQTDVYHQLDKINALRNRVAHHEPVCFGPGNTVSTAYARGKLQEIMDVFVWLDVNGSALIYGLDGIYDELDFIDTNF